MYPGDVDEGGRDDLIPSKAPQVHGSSSAPYYCLVSTLNPDSTTFAYRYEAFDLDIPKEWIRQAQQNNVAEKWVTYQLSSPNATGRTQADPAGSARAVVRLAQCRVPDMPQITGNIQTTLKKFGPKSWAYNQRDMKAPARAAMPENSSQCTLYLNHYSCDPDYTNFGLDPAENPLCTLESSDCIQYEYLADSEENEQGPGGSSSGGNAGDMCQPIDSGNDNSDPALTNNDGVPMSCPQEDPCEGPNPPEWCACEDTDDPNLDNAKEEIAKLREDSNMNAPDQLDRVEQGMWMIQDPVTGARSYERFDEGFSDFGPCGFNYNNPSIPANAVAWVHTQPFEIGEINHSCSRYSKSKVDMLIQLDPSIRNEYVYKGTASQDDLEAAALFKNYLPGLKSYIVDKDGITEYNENSDTEDLGDDPRHTQNCYQN